jgi:pyruvate phosphate dikinase-like enzyme
LPEAAFAGQQETFLNIVGQQALFEAIRACWASLWSERAILYRAHQNADQASVKLAVVVQKMVPADAAGVMFTADPVSGARDELVIAANPGLGEAVVGGLVTPDQFVVQKRSVRIKLHSIGRREVVIRSKAGGGTESIIPSGNPSGRWRRQFRWHSLRVGAPGMPGWLRGSSIQRGAGAFVSPILLVVMPRMGSALGQSIRITPTLQPPALDGRIVSSDPWRWSW